MKTFIFVFHLNSIGWSSCERSLGCAWMKVAGVIVLRTMFVFDGSIADYFHKTQLHTFGQNWGCGFLSAQSETRIFIFKNIFTNLYCKTIRTTTLIINSNNKKTNNPKKNPPVSTVNTAVLILACRRLDISPRPLLLHNNTSHPPVHLTSSPPRADSQAPPCPCPQPPPGYADDPFWPPSRSRTIHIHVKMERKKTTKSK